MSDAPSLLEPVRVPVSHGALEGLLLQPPVPARAVLVCHPHPLFGGSMHDVRAYRVARALALPGASVLRFNFRGVGASSGAWDEGRGELEDARAALAFLRARAPGVPVWLAGFSFGAWVAARLAAEELQVQALLLAGVPLQLFGFEALARVRAPTAVVQADRDEYGALPQVREALEALRPAHHLEVLEAADHLATGRLQAFEAALESAVAWLSREGRGPVAV